MSEESLVGWTFSESMVQVRKPFEQLVRVIVVSGFVINAVLAALLYFGVIKLPAHDAQKTKPVPPPAALLDARTSLHPQLR